MEANSDLCLAPAPPHRVVPQGNSRCSRAAHAQTCHSTAVPESPWGLSGAAGTALPRGRGCWQASPPQPLPPGRLCLVVSEPDSVVLSAKMCPRSVRGLPRSPLLALRLCPSTRLEDASFSLLFSDLVVCAWWWFRSFSDLCVYHFHQIRTFGHYFSVFFLPLPLPGTWRTVCLSGALCGFGSESASGSAPAPVRTLLSPCPPVRSLCRSCSVSS